MIPSAKAWPQRLRRFELQALVSRLGPALGLAAVWLLFALLEGRDFVSWSNQRLMLLQTAVVATAALGGTLVIIAGGIDLSVGSAIAFGTMMIALALKSGFSPSLSALIGVAMGFAIGVAMGAMIIGRIGRIAGLLSGGVVAYATWSVLPHGLAIGLGVITSTVLWFVLDRALGMVPLSPFIVTLGMWGALRGAAKGLGNNQPIYPDPTWLTDLMQPSKHGIFAVLAPGVWLMLLLAVLMSLLLRYTRFGRHAYAIGSNELTARLCGVQVDRTKLVIYGLAAACAGVAAILQFAFLYGQGDPTYALMKHF